MSVRRENTFRIDYANMPRKPSFEELHEFVATKLGLQYEQVVRLQPSRTLGCAFVKVVDLDLARKIVAEHDNKHEVVMDGKTYKLRITLEDGAVEVKLTDLSEDVTNEQIAEFLGSYGEVLTITEQVWDSKYRFAGLPTGARIVRMMVKRNIESYVTIEGQKTNVHYFGQLQTCRYCSEYIHNGISCVQNKKLLVQKTYANVAKETAPNAPASTASTSKQTPTFANLFGPTPSEASKQQPNKAAAIHTVSAVSKPSTSKPAGTLAASSHNQNSSLMPPPISVAPYQAPFSTNRTMNDGNETDDSTTSTKSQRNKHGRPSSKKQRTNSGVSVGEETVDIN